MLADEAVIDCVIVEVVMLLVCEEDGVEVVDEFVGQEHCLEIASMPSRLMPFSAELLPYSSCFTQQYALPCAQKILKKIEANGGTLQERYPPPMMIKALSTISSQFL